MIFLQKSKRKNELVAIPAAANFWLAALDVDRSMVVESTSEMTSVLGDEA